MAGLRPGCSDLGVRGNRPSQPTPNPQTLADTLSDYGESNEGRGLTAETQGYYSRLAREYLLFLEGLGTVKNLAHFASTPYSASA